MINKGKLEQDIIRVLKTCYDPEIPVDIYELGLIYEININDDADVEIVMTLTSPNCPVAESLPYDVKMQLLKIEGVKSVNVKLVWEPEWNRDMLSEEAKLELGFL